MIGKRFGKLIAVKFVKMDARNSQLWEMLCDCGTTVIKLKKHLVANSSCGCGRIKHGQHGTKEYVAWKSMHYRCTNKNNKRWADYGGRGITVCKEWGTFEQFFADMGYAPGEEYSLDRIENEGNYEPSNCQWSTKSEQMLNTRRSK